MAWEYRLEEKWLNEMAASGWQLVKGGCFSQKFVKDDAARYCVRLDYKKMPTGEEAERYKEMFEEQGWEYVNSTFNGWHYFRKKIKEGEPEGAYEIYTDRESVREMTGRWKHLALGAAAVFGIFAVFYGYLCAADGLAPHMFYAVFYLLGCLFLLNCVRKMGLDDLS